MRLICLWSSLGKFSILMISVRLGNTLAFSFAIRSFEAISSV